jgi:hypothetical protein
LGSVWLQTLLQTRSIHTRTIGLIGAIVIVTIVTIVTSDVATMTGETGDMAERMTVTQTWVARSIFVKQH